MSTLDKYILRGLVTNYLIAIAVMMSVYVVLDLFFNIDEFTEIGGGAGQVLADVVSFYGNRIFLYFAQLSGVITLFACLITLARMRRMNELTAVLASGVSLYRVAAPVVLFAVFTTGLWYVNTEVVIPSIAHKLARQHEDARGLRTFAINFLNDRDNALLSARQYVPTEQILKRVAILKRTKDGDWDSVIEADQAYWEPPTADQPVGRWRLERGIERKRSVEIAGGIQPQGSIVSRTVAFHDSDLDPKTIEMRQSAGWLSFLSTAQLRTLSQHLDGESLRHTRTIKHARFTTPFANIVMLLLGLPFILSRSPGSLLIEGSKALLVCGSCFLLVFVVQNLGVRDSLSALPAWAPIIVFTPLAAILLDRIRT